MQIPLYIKRLYYNLPIPEFITIKISGRLFSRKFNEEVKLLKY